MHPGMTRGLGLPRQKPYDPEQAGAPGRFAGRAQMLVMGRALIALAALAAPHASTGISAGETAFARASGWGKLPLLRIAVISAAVLPKRPEPFADDKARAAMPRATISALTGRADKRRCQTSG